MCGKIYKNREKPLLMLYIGVGPTKQKKEKEMKLKIIFEVKSKITGQMKEVYKTFSNFAEDVTDDRLKQFAIAYAGLVDKNAFESYKIITEQLN